MIKILIFFSKVFVFKIYAQLSENGKNGGLYASVNPKVHLTFLSVQLTGKSLLLLFFFFFFFVGMNHDIKHI